MLQGAVQPFKGVVQVLFQRAQLRWKLNPSNVKETSDPEFDELVQRFFALEQSLQKLCRETKQYMEATRSYLHITCALSESFHEMYTSSSKMQPVVQANMTACKETYNKYKANHESEIQLKVLDPVQQFLITAVPNIKARIAQRKKLLEDYDVYNALVDKMRTNPTTEVGRLAQKETKLLKLRAAYTEVHDKLLADLKKIDEQKTTILDLPFNTLLSGRLGLVGDSAQPLKVLQQSITSDMPTMQTNIILWDIEKAKSPLLESDSSSTTTSPSISPLQLVTTLPTESPLSNLIDSNGNLNPSGYTVPDSRQASVSTEVSSGTCQLSPSFTEMFTSPPSQAGSPNKIPVPRKSGNRLSLSKPVKRHVRAISDFTGIESGELTFHKGDLIEVIGEDESGWWDGALNGKLGMFPITYVQPADC